MPLILGESPLNRAVFTERLHLSTTNLSTDRLSDMYTRQLQKAAHTRKFTISSAGESGWEVRDEHDSRVIRWVRYHDWHRVERARMSFALEAAMLEESGWNEA
jgi:hypothetical protein